MKTCPSSAANCPMEKLHSSWKRKGTSPAAPLNCSVSTETLTFDEEQDVITLSGSPGNPASISKPKEARGQTILFDRKKNTVIADGVTVISGELPEADRLRPLEDRILAMLSLIPQSTPPLRGGSHDTYGRTVALSSISVSPRPSYIAASDSLLQ